MAERPGASRRAACRRSFSDHTLPAEYLERLEQKRKQLDESIHKYIAAKEREYKGFEKDLRQEHKLSQGQAARNVALSHTLSESMRDSEQHVALQAEHVSAVDTVLTSPNRAAVDTPTPALQQATPEQWRLLSKLQDGMGSSEREQYLTGLFTPSYLAALDAEDAKRVKRAASDPEVSSTANTELLTPGSTASERANSESLAQGNPLRPSARLLAQRNSSSDASADGRLASAMRSPTQQPKRKRVSLALGDSIVKPSDNVPDALSHNTTSSHSRRRLPTAERDLPVLTKRSSPLNREQLLLEPTLLSAANTGSNKAEKQPATLAVAAAESTPAEQSQSTSTLIPVTAKPRKLDPDGDLFDLADEDSDAEPSHPSFDESAIANESDDDNDDDEDDEIAGRGIQARPSPHSPPPANDDEDNRETRYDATTGLIPEPSDKAEDSAVPYLSFGPGSALAPTEPGFRRPAVLRDPVYIGPDYEAAERIAVERDVYGSSTKDLPGNRGSFAAGSLGESYMAQHAEQMMKMRHSRQGTPVKS
ncbi:hypothetical protein BDY17DRAFT_299363 [Neohortaea acidophila]|uniref:Uncharacterized protein n=1 Tax=Neohortaea acidophila TaxID=245834 RepID=A0A6A6PNE6_9PEZI|nr:uncharacterized protein BDY17DRAFT_299363 [Neohortaea acidophila]KAF2481628.1 hypothetical protein BDY17DRAFT_299363 [Neohortaea acidophila]